MPLISIIPGSECRIGKGSVLVSASFATALGVNHPVVLRTLRTGARIEIGARVGISGGSICAAALVKIGDDTMIGANVVIADTDFHSLMPRMRVESREREVEIGIPVEIGERVFIGANSVILKGVSIGNNTVIGAGSIVTKSVPGNLVAAGNPCRPLRELTELELKG
jgi:acetyltransferase-like isoleucine patch superfamily enzyme